MIIVVIAKSLAYFLGCGGRSAVFSFFVGVGMSDGERKDGRCDKYTAISAARASEGSRGIESECVKEEECWVFFSVVLALPCRQRDFYILVGRSIVNKDDTASDVSTSRRFEHDYSDKVVERTKWSIFVQGR